MKTLYYLPLTLFQILLTPTPTSLSPPNPTPTARSVVMCLWLNGWSRHNWCTILLNDDMDLYMSSLCTLVPEGPWCVFYATKRQGYWGLTHNVVFYWYSDLILHTHTNTQHTQGPVDCHTHMNVYLHHLLCAHSSYLYYIKMIKWIIHWYQKFTFHNFFSQLFTCKSHLSVD